MILVIIIIKYYIIKFHIRELQSKDRRFVYNEHYGYMPFTFMSFEKFLLQKFVKRTFHLIKSGLIILTVLSYDPVIYDLW